MSLRTYQRSLAGPKPSGAATCASGIAFSDLPNGDYTFSVAPTDQAGNIGDPVAYRWQVDNSIDKPPPPPGRPDSTADRIARRPAKSSAPVATVGAAWCSASPRARPASHFVCRLDRRRPPAAPLPAPTWSASAPTSSASPPPMPPATRIRARPSFRFRVRRR